MNDRVIEALRSVASRRGVTSLSLMPADRSLYNRLVACRLMVKSSITGRVKYHVSAEGMRVLFQASAHEWLKRNVSG